MLLLPFCILAFNLCNVSFADESGVFQSPEEYQEFTRSYEEFYIDWFYCQAMALPEARKIINENRDFEQNLQGFIKKLQTQSLSVFQDKNEVKTKGKIRAMKDPKGLKLADAETKIKDFRQKYEGLITKFKQT